LPHQQTENNSVSRTEKSVEFINFSHTYLLVLKTGFRQLPVKKN